VPRADRVRRRPARPPAQDALGPRRAQRRHPGQGSRAHQAVRHVPQRMLVHVVRPYQAAHALSFAVGCSDKIMLVNSDALTYVLTSAPLSLLYPAPDAQVHSSLQIFQDEAHAATGSSATKEGLSLFGALAGSLARSFGGSPRLLTDLFSSQGSSTSRARRSASS